MAAAKNTALLLDGVLVTFALGGANPGAAPGSNREKPVGTPA